MTNKNFEKREITKIFKTGSDSSTLIIPKHLAKQSGLDKPCHVLVESVNGAITVKKLDLMVIQ